ncbi:NAD(P)-binding protein [Pleomassaria siparia CBS 279.74]|uniref:NAD(P)-binding protein n=1 Tax=Pleomassaria siparia CBS 279.74 TaxID=1314801 RepID=A0A6G1JXY4_9PLEO|nr:NAD(P)-binding protein [Pleomassaria siparia CBS 279.74]
MSPKVVFISGANRGLGKGLLRLYLARPNHIVIAANRDPSHPTSGALSQIPTGHGSRLIVVKVDASVQSDAADAVKALAEQGIHHLDLVIANAGVSYVWPSVKDLDVKDLEGHMVPNVYGVVWLYQATRDLLEKAERPIWATMGSIAGWIENQYPITNAAYGPSKAAIHWITKSINTEEKKIASIVMSPGFVQTDMGNVGAAYFGMGKPELTVEDSCNGMLKLLDQVSKESHGGKLWDYTASMSDCYDVSSCSSRYKELIWVSFRLET